MKSRIWHLAGVGLLCMSVSAQLLAENDREDQRRPPEHSGGEGGRARENPPEIRPGNTPSRQEHNSPGPQNEIIRGDNSRQFEHRAQQNPGAQHQGGQWQNRLYDPNAQGRPAAAPGNSLPIHSRPDSVRQTQEPLRGYYQDIPRRSADNPRWQGGGQGMRPGSGERPDDHRWAGRPNGHGNGWGPGPQYRPGHEVERFPQRHDRVQYRGQDYFFSGGYWYRPHGPRYVVVRPPYGIRVRYLPDFAQEVWIGGALLFLAAGAYYSYLDGTQEYVVVQPPVAQPQGNGYDVVAYPVSGQTPEQVNRDGYECYRWAVGQSGFDPRAFTYQPAPQVIQAYRQAQGNCLSSRGYQVQ